jgi:hypothetical protein
MEGKREMGDTSIAIPKQHCPFCGYQCDRTDGLETPMPEPGDISLCLKCMEVSLFTDDFKLREPSTAELIEIQRSTAWPQIEKARAAWRQLGIKKQIVADGR